MKNSFLLMLLIVVFSITTIIAQNDCGTVIPAGVTVQQAQSGNLTLYKRSTMTEPLRLAIHIVRTSNGSGGISESALNAKIAALNSRFQQAYFQFEVKQIDYIDSDQLYWIDGESEANQLLTTNNKPGYINIYFINTLYVYNLYLNGLATFSPRINTSGIHGVIVTNSAHSTTLPHEMGHYFDLFHTFETLFGYENIARTGSCTNWDYTGDLLMDTPADPSARVTFATIDHLNCQWITPPIKPLPLDGCNQNNYQPLANNMMHTQVPQCRFDFTDDQIDRMNETLQLYRIELLKNIVYLENRIGTQNANGTINIGNTTYQSGKYAFLNEGIYTFKTNNERFTNFQNTSFNYKHNNWNLLSSKLYLENIDYIQNEYSEEIAMFNQIKYAKASALLEELEISNKGEFEFQDPWYVKSDGTQPGNYWIPCVSSYEPTGKEGAVEKGVFLNQDYNVPGAPYYSVKAAPFQDIYLSNTGRVHKFHFQNWSYDPNKISLEYSNALETGIVFKETNAQLSANYKGTQLTTSAEALTRNGANKLVNLTGSDLFFAYESMGNIWFENSTDGGSTWSLLNNGNRINQQNGKEPVVVKLNPSQVLVAYFEDADPNAYPQENGKIKGVIFDVVYNQIVDDYVIKVWEDWETFTFTDIPYLTMSFSSSGDPRGIVAWSEGNDAYYVYLKFNPTTYQITHISQPDVCLSMEDPITDLSVASAPSFESFPLTFHIAGVWNNGGTSSTDMIYRKLTATNSSSNYLSGSTLYYISSGSGYSLNQYPSLIEVVSGGQSAARIVWRGERVRGSEEEEFGLNKNTKNDETLSSEEDREANIIFVDPETPNNFWVFGSRGSANKPVIVRTDPLTGTNKGYAFAWSEEEGSLHYYAKNSTLSMTGYSGSGKDVQLTSGIDGSNNLTHLRALGLNYNSAPYFFQASAQIIGGLQKENKTSIKLAREGIVYKEKGTFYFSIGDISVDGTDIEFVEFPDSVIINNINQFNSYLETKPFSINNQAEFYYSVQYGVTDSALAVHVLNAADIVNYQVELINALTNEVLGIFDNITFSSVNVSQYANLSYKVNTEGIGEKTVKLRLKVTENISSSFSIARKMNDGYLFAKRGYKEINYSGIMTPTEYALYQNYPNPFNPVTAITYQIPKGGLVTLKIYDILGKEVTTLINEEKQAGKYSIEFNASKLSSGVYLYELRSNEYKSTKKLLLMK